MKIKKSFALLMVLILVATTLTGCKGKSLSEEKIEYKYNKKLENIEIINKSKEKVYADFNIVLLDKQKDVLYKVAFEKEILKKGTEYYNLEELTPEYISNDKIDSMDVELISVNEFNYAGIILILIVLLIAAKKYFNYV